MKHGIAISDGNGLPYSTCDERIYSDRHIPEAALLACVGKSPIDIIKGHPDVDKRYTEDDRIVAARWYPYSQITGFDVVCS